MQRHTEHLVLGSAPDAQSCDRARMLAIRRTLACRQRKT